MKLAEHSATIERLNRELARLTTGLSQRENELVQYREYGERAKRRVVELEDELSNRTSRDADRVAELDRRQSLLAERDRQIESLNAELAKAQDAAVSAERLAEELKAVHGDAASKERALHEYEQTVESQNAAIEEGRRQIEDLENRIRELSGEADRDRAELTAKTDELERTRAQLDDMRELDSERAAEIEGLERLLDERGQSLRKAEEESEQLRTKARLLEEELQELQGAVEDKDHAADRIAEELTSVKDSLAEALEEKSHHERVAADAKSERDQQVEEVSRLKAKLEEIQRMSPRDETDSLREEIESLRHELDEVRAENERLQSELTSRTAVTDRETDSDGTESAPAGEGDVSGTTDRVPDVVRPEDDDQRMLVDALLRFLGRR